MVKVGEDQEMVPNIARPLMLIVRSNPEELLRLKQQKLIQPMIHAAIQLGERGRLTPTPTPGSKGSRIVPTVSAKMEEVIQAIAGAIYMRAAQVPPNQFLEMKVPTVREVFGKLAAAEDARVAPDTPGAGAAAVQPGGVSPPSRELGKGREGDNAGAAEKPEASSPSSPSSSSSSSSSSGDKRDVVREPVNEQLSKRIIKEEGLPADYQYGLPSQLVVRESMTKQKT